MADLKKPLVSIVIPAFNAGEYLREAIDSVLNQSYPNIELIVLDDGSTDDTSKILNSYPEKDFYRESHPNMGQAATLNKGWAMARGEILGYLSADDALFPGAVATALFCFRDQPEIVMTYSDYEYMDENSSPIKTISLPDFSYSEMIYKNVCVPGPGAFWRRSAYERVGGGWNTKLRQTPDYEFWLRLGLQGKFYHINEVLARFRVHKGSQTCSASDVAKSEEMVQVMEGYFKQPDIPYPLLSGRTGSLANAHIFSATLHLMAGRFSYAFRHIHQAIGLMPSALLKLGNIRRLAGGIWHFIRNRIG